MNKPIDTISFWNQRILEAKEEGDFRSSVFKTNQWTSIDAAHKRILQRYIKPSDIVLDAGCGYGRAVGIIPACSTYIGVDQVPDFIQEARKQYHKRMTSSGVPGPTDKDVYYLVSDLKKIQFDDNYFNWVVGISLMVMIISNLGWGKWDAMQKELLRVSRNGILCLEYTDPEVYYLIRGD